MSVPCSLDKGPVETAPDPTGAQESVPLIGQNIAVRDADQVNTPTYSLHGHNADTMPYIIPLMHKCDVCIPSSFLSVGPPSTKSLAWLFFD